MKRAVWIVLMLALLALSSALALAGQFAVYPGSKFVPSDVLRHRGRLQNTRCPVTVVAFYAEIGALARSIEKGGRQTMLSFDGRVEAIA